ncbi:MAG: hypothetical protein IJ632_01730 [Muribaculaceae bacterium]|nr:hypothetical protein [Muribaculaceae bacterium]
MLRKAKAMLSQYTVVYDVSHATGMADMEHMFLTLKGRSLRNGATFTSSVPLYGANSLQAGVMTASHVQTLMALQTTLHTGALSADGMKKITNLFCKTQYYGYLCPTQKRTTAIAMLLAKKRAQAQAVCCLKNQFSRSNFGEHFRIHKLPDSG